MVSIRVLTEVEGDWREVARPYGDDVARIVRAFELAGYRATADQAAEIWCRFSADLCAGWLDPDFYLAGQAFSPETLEHLRLLFGPTG